MELAEQHEKQNPAENKAERLARLETTPKDFKNKCDHLSERLRRETAIPEEDIEEAIEFAGTIPKRILLSDCGGQFLRLDYQELLEHLGIKDKQTPPGQPRYNGALESGNRDLKHVILTIAFHEACRRPDISEVKTSRKDVFDFFKSCCRKAQEIINEKIPRVKFGTTPMAVLNDEIAARKEQRDLFTEQKAEVRKQRMQKIKQGEITCKNKTVGDKVKAVWRRISKMMSTNELFAFTELLNKRYQAVTN